VHYHHKRAWGLLVKNMLAWPGDVNVIHLLWVSNCQCEEYPLIWALIEFRGDSFLVTIVEPCGQPLGGREKVEFLSDEPRVGVIVRFLDFWVPDSWVRLVGSKIIPREVRDVKDVYRRYGRIASPGHQSKVPR